MSDPIYMTVDELMKLADENGILEIVQRIKGSKFKNFSKAILQNPSSSNDLKDAASKLLTKTDKLSKLLSESSVQLSTIANLSTLNVILNGANLCATAAGFAIMNEKLNAISSKIDNIVSLQQQIQAQDAKYKFKNTYLDYRDLLDHKKRHLAISEDKYISLLNKECSVFEYLYSGFINETQSDKADILYALKTLAQMITCNIASLDEIYYFNNKDQIVTGSVWHESHTDWENIYKLLESNLFIEKLQDYCFIESGLDQFTTDIFTKAFVSSISEMKQAVKDRQKIILFAENKERYDNISKTINIAVENEINNEIPNIPLEQAAVAYA